MTSPSSEDSPMTHEHKLQNVHLAEASPEARATLDGLLEALQAVMRYPEMRAYIGSVLSGQADVAIARALGTNSKPVPAEVAELNKQESAPPSSMLGVAEPLPQGIVSLGEEATRVLADNLEDLYDTGGVAAGVPVNLADAQMLLAWMDETFGNDSGTDWLDEEAAAVGDALNKAIEDFKGMRASLPPSGKVSKGAAAVRYDVLQEIATTFGLDYNAVCRTANTYLGGKGTGRTTPTVEAHGTLFRVADNGILRFADDSCRPATAPEKAMWKKLMELSASPSPDCEGGGKGATAISEGDVTAALLLAHLKDTRESRKDMRRALEGVFSPGIRGTAEGQG